MADGIATDGLAVLAAAGAMDSAKNTPTPSPMHLKSVEKVRGTPEPVLNHSRSVSPSSRPTQPLPHHVRRQDLRLSENRQFQRFNPSRQGARSHRRTSLQRTPHEVLPQVATHASDPDQRAEKGCNCKNSKCLKLYCECFSKTLSCGPHCNCRNCRNNGNYPRERQHAVEAILERNPNAFQPKVKRKQPGEIGQPSREKHQKGCNCRKSGCLKRYCECFQASVLCSELCKCVNCRNFEGSSEATHARGPALQLAVPHAFDRNPSPAVRKAPLLAPAPAPHDALALGKRTPLQQLALTLPPAKRVLLQKGPAFRSRVGTLGSPGGLHYETSEVYEDHPENMLAAAMKALDPTIVADAEKDTALLLRLFEDAMVRASASGTGESRRRSNGVDKSVANNSIGRGDVRAEPVSLMCDEDELDEEAPIVASNGHPPWYEETEKRALELCARALYVISGSSRPGGSGTAIRRRKMGSSRPSP